MLWKLDANFPAWAWVFDDEGMDSRRFLEGLKGVCAMDGFNVEIVMLYGADCYGPDNPPESFLGCKMVILSDAARKAEYRRRSSDRLKGFNNCSSWHLVSIKDDELERRIRLKVKMELANNDRISVEDRGAEESCEEVGCGDRNEEQENNDVVMESGDEENRDHEVAMEDCKEGDSNHEIAVEKNSHGIKNSP